MRSAALGTCSYERLTTLCRADTAQYLPYLFFFCSLQVLDLLGRST